MKIKSFFVLAVVFACSSFAFSQEKKAEPIKLVVKTFVTTTTYTSGQSKSSSSKHYYFVVGKGGEQMVGGGGKNLRPYYKSSPEALKELDLCKKNAHMSNYMLIPLIGGPIMALVGAVSVKDSVGNLKPVNPIMISGLVFFVGGYIAGKVFSSKAIKHMERSVDEYNKSISASSFLRRVTPDQFGFLPRRNRLELMAVWKIDYNQNKIGKLN